MDSPAGLFTLNKMIAKIASDRVWHGIVGVRAARVLVAVTDTVLVWLVRYSLLAIATRFCRHRFL